jgi:hypothetical protein
MLLPALIGKKLKDWETPKLRNISSHFANKIVLYIAPTCKTSYLLPDFGRYKDLFTSQ